MKFELIDQRIVNESVLPDSRDNLECFGDFSKTNKICMNYCAACIRCAIEHSQNPKIDILDHLLTLDFFSAKIH